jgi:signal transduction histidine kinase/DNA-binding response OmpR family regulator
MLNPGDSAASQTILLVDDSVYWTDTLADALRRSGFAVSVVHDGLIAVERLRKQLPDILITDYFLPNLDGGKLCQLAKRLADGSPIATIILTGGADANLSRRPSQYADAVIAKNSIDVVIKDLSRALGDLRAPNTGSTLDSVVIGHERLPPRALSAKLVGLKQYLDALHEGIGDAVIGVDAQRKVYFMNSTALDLLGVPEERALAQSVEFVLGIDASHPIMQRMEEAFGGASPQQGPLSVKLRSSTLRVTVSRLNTPGGQDTALLIARDISDLIAAEAERTSLSAQLHAADKMRSLGQMTAGMSHEINNPLAALLPTLEALSERFMELADFRFASSHNDAKTQRALREIPELLADATAAGRQIKSVVAEMRSFAHPGESRGEQVPLDSLIKDATLLVAREVRFKARLEQSLDYSPSLVVDRALLSQALLNILINASQSIEAGAPERHWIRVATRAYEGGVLIELSNSGEPISEENVGKVFDPFFTTKGPGAGVGLGLSIAHETIGHHGGYIELTTTPHTTFSIWLPLDTGKVVHTVQPLANEPLEVGNGANASTRVLIVDDEHLVRNGFRRALDRHFEVSLAAGGQQALSLIAQNDYDVVLCDLLMPEITGMDLFHRVQASNPDLAARFVFLTGGTANNEAREFLHSVKNARAFKPLDNEELVRLVERAAGRRRSGGAAKDASALAARGR